MDEKEIEQLFSVSDENEPVDPDFIEEEETEQEEAEADETSVEAEKQVTDGQEEQASALLGLASGYGADKEPQDGLEADVDTKQAAAFQRYRQRAQEAERKAAELEQRLLEARNGYSSSETTYTEAENSGVDIDDDDFVIGKDVKALLNNATKQITETVQQRLAREAAERQSVDYSRRVAASEPIARQKYPDFDEVIKLSQTEAFRYTLSEIQAIQSASDPAETAYRLMTGKRDSIRKALGIDSAPQKPQGNTVQQTEQNGAVTEDDAFNAWAFS